MCGVEDKTLVALYDAVNTEYRNRGGKGETPVEIMRSYAAFNHKDQNHNEIADALRKQGNEVVEIMQPLDLLVRSPHGVTAFAEVKQPGSKAKWTRPQLRFITETRFPVVVVTSVTGTLLGGFWEGLGCVWITQPQKDRLAGFLLRNNDKFFTPKEIAEVMG